MCPHWHEIDGVYGINEYCRALHKKVICAGEWKSCIQKDMYEPDNLDNLQGKYFEFVKEVMGR